MYRCIECRAAFEYKPDYCECGNDTFEEAYGYSQQQPSPAPNPSPNSSPKRKKTYSVKEIASISIFVICIILSIFAWVFIGKDSSGQKSSQGASSQQGSDSVSTSNIPDINSIWDNSLPISQNKVGELTGQAQPKQLLNSNMKSLSAEMRAYVLTLGRTFVSSWPKGTVVGDGSCEIEFSVGKDGRIVNKKIHKASENKTLNDSVSTMLENVTQTSVPPVDYKGENIIMAFSILHREFKVYYPHY